VAFFGGDSPDEKEQVSLSRIRGAGVIVSKLEDFPRARTAEFSCPPSPEYAALKPSISATRMERLKPKGKLITGSRISLSKAGRLDSQTQLFVLLSQKG
jgi:hypothetical protein